MRTETEILYDCKQAPKNQSWTMYARRHPTTVHLKIVNYAIIDKVFSAQENQPTLRIDVH